jgi:hypothetical protein
MGITAPEGVFGSGRFILIVPEVVWTWCREHLLLPEMKSWSPTTSDLQVLELEDWQMPLLM